MQIAYMLKMTHERAAPEAKYVVCDCHVEQMMFAL